LNFATAQHIIEFYRMRHAQPARSRAPASASAH
jgi:hypothetical protein